MKVRLGYVAMAIDLKDCSPSKTITYTRYEKLKDDELKLYKLNKLTEKNLENTRRILLYNKSHNIKVYRLTSKIVPLATHNNVIEWDYVSEYTKIYNSISNIIKENNMRISAHPDHFTIISSPREDVVEASIKDLIYHNNIMNAMGLSSSEGKLVLHIGGKYDSKEKTKLRFIDNFRKLPEEIRNRIILENDDKIYNIEDVLEITKELNIPMVVDIHHHWCNHKEDNLDNLLEQIFDTWNNQKLSPKIHISSPKSDKKKRAHADNVDFNFFYDFMKNAKKVNRDFDIMIEAKNKNVALFNLMENIKENENFKIINNSTFEM
ncbi:UV DNA damage repair endonuclease UvsE [Sporosalibacterium faouarense]|uniref:UV DNA damage repair endonuclease UvsE n=1 Tax=Sporosalibacterium faouarense TaxID=516123 RepID=UPI00192C1703|nr:UV DNA damage repair endonuclease UvsE [Sporosalibacterium faouarense]